MNISPHERALLPFIALQGAVGTLIGFIGFFVMATHDVNAMLRFTATMLTAAMVSTFISYLSGPRLHLDGRRLLKLGFLIPGLLILFGHRSVMALAIAYGSFVGMTWSARHWLEMSLLPDAERDGYAARAGTVTVVLGVTTTLAATLLLAASTEQSRTVYWLYGALCMLGAFALGNRLPRTEPVSLRDPIGVLRQPQFLACLPLFFLESGLFGVSQALASAGAVQALGAASQFGWVTTVAGLAGGAALFISSRKRGVHNRARWMGGSSLAVAIAFVMLGASTWIPALFVAYSVLRAAAGPFLAASQHVLNQRTLDIQGNLSDRIFARELMLWLLRMLSLGLFWMLAGALPPRHVLTVGSALLAVAVCLEYVIGKAWFSDIDTAAEPAA